MSIEASISKKAFDALEGIAVLNQGDVRKYA
jgi:hypothetical protein